MWPSSQIEMPTNAHALVAPSSTLLLRHALPHPAPICRPAFLACISPYPTHPLPTQNLPPLMKPICGSPADRSFALGLFGSILCVLLFASPLSTLREVLATKNAASICEQFHSSLPPRSSNQIKSCRFASLRVPSLPFPSLLVFSLLLSSLLFSSHPFLISEGGRLWLPSLPFL